MLGPPRGGRSCDWGRHCPHFWNENWVFANVSFARGFRTLGGIARRVLGV